MHGCHQTKPKLYNRDWNNEIGSLMAHTGGDSNQIQIGVSEMSTDHTSTSNLIIDLDFFVNQILKSTPTVNKEDKIMQIR